MALTICVADDHELILHGIRAALQASSDFEVVGVTRVGEEVLALVERCRPDVVLLDGQMGAVKGVDCLREIKRRWPEIQVVMLSASEDPKRIGEALAAGASAYLGKRIIAADLPSVLRQVVAGVVYQRSALGEEPGDERDCSLTARERMILEAMASGHSTKVISRDLWITEKTVKFHLTNIYRKLDVHNRTGAMRYAFEHGLIAAGTDAPQLDALTA